MVRERYGRAGVSAAAFIIRTKFGEILQYELSIAAGLQVDIQDTHVIAHCS